MSASSLDQAFVLTKEAWLLDQTCHHFVKQFHHDTQLPIPSYLDIDDKPTAATRARLRFNFCNLNGSLHNRQLIRSPACSCGAAEESPEHVVLACPRFEMARHALQVELGLLQTEHHCFQIAISTAIVLGDLSGLPEVAHKDILRVSAKFLRRLRQIRRA